MNTHPKGTFTVDQIIASKGQQANAFVTFDNVVCGRGYHNSHGWVKMAQELTEMQQTAMVAYFGKGCQARTVQAIREAVANPGALKTYGIFSRICIYRDRVEYIPGQDMPEEIKTIRKLIKQRKA